MLKEMTGQERQDWHAYYALKSEERMEKDLDSKGQRNLRLAR